MTAQWKRSTETEQDGNGIPYSGVTPAPYAEAFVYNAGTTTPRPVYSDASLTSQIAQPFRTDSLGRWPQVFVSDGVYRTVIRTSTGLQILDEDNIDPGLATSVGGALPVAKGGTGGITPAAARNGIGAAAQSDLNAVNLAVGSIQTGVAANASAIATVNNTVSALTTSIANLIDPSGSRRQCVQSGPVDVNGFSTFIPTSSGSLSITTANITPIDPLVVSCSKGFLLAGSDERFGIATGNFVFPNLTPSALCFLFVTINTDGTLTPGHTVLEPVYRRGGLPSNTLTQYTFLIDKMKGYVGNGTSADEVSRVYIGEALTNATGVTSAVGYAVQCEQEYSPLVSLPTAGFFNSFHNLGFTNYSVELSGQCIVAEHGYSAGDVIFPLMTAAPVPNTSAPFSPIFTRLRNSVRTTWGSTGSYAMSSTGGLAVLTPANWRPVFRVRRSW